MSLLIPPLQPPQIPLSDDLQAPGGPVTPPFTPPPLPLNSALSQSGAPPLPPGSGSPQDASAFDLSALGGLSDFAAFMILAIRSASEQRSANYTARQLESQQIETKLKDAAADMRNGAIVAMALGIVAGAMSIAGGIAGMAKAGQAMKATSGQEALLAQGQAWMQVWSGGSTIVSSTGQGVQGILQANSKDKEAEAEEMRSEKDMLKEATDNLSDYIHTLQQIIQTMLEKENDALAHVLA